MKKLFSIPPVDDRGRRLNFSSFDDARPLFAKIPAWKLVLPIGLGFASVILSLVSHATRGSFTWGVFFHPLSILFMCCVAFAVVASVARTARRFTQLTSWDRIPTSCAWLVAHRRCGACGYDLASADPEPDGCVACPECGAAWHQDRFTLVGRDPSRPPHSLLYHGKADLAPPQTAYDDRRVPFDAPLSLSAPWRASGATPQRNLALFDQRVRELQTSLVRTTTGFGLLSLVGIVVLAVFVSDHTAAPAVAATMVILLLGAPAAIILERRHRTGSQLNARAAALIAGLCPHCGTPFPAAGRPSSFDGCSHCDNCGRAWRSEAIRNRPPISIAP